MKRTESKDVLWSRAFLPHKLVVRGRPWAVIHVPRGDPDTRGYLIPVQSSTTRKTLENNIGHDDGPLNQPLPVTAALSPTPPALRHSEQHLDVSVGVMQVGRVVRVK